MDTTCEHDWSLILVMKIPDTQIERFKLVGSFEIRAMGEQIQQITGPVCSKCNIPIESVFETPVALDIPGADEYLNDN